MIRHHVIRVRFREMILNRRVLRVLISNLEASMWVPRCVGINESTAICHQLISEVDYPDISYLCLYLYLYPNLCLYLYLYLEIYRSRSMSISRL